MTCSESKNFSVSGVVSEEEAQKNKPPWPALEAEALQQGALCYSFCELFGCSIIAGCWGSPQVSEQYPCSS